MNIFFHPVLRYKPPSLASSVQGAMTFVSQSLEKAQSSRSHGFNFQENMDFWLFDSTVLLQNISISVTTYYVAHRDSITRQN